MNIKISNHLFLTDTPFRFAELIRKRLTLQNPAFDDAVRMNRWRGNLDEYLRCYRQNENGLIIPRGFCGQLIGMAKQSGVTYQIEDRRRTLPQVDFNFAGTLKPFQQKAVELMLKKDFGTLSSPTGSGKTIMALSIIEQRQQPALIIVHTKELLNQWVDMIETFLDIPKAEIGIIGNGKKQIGDKITVGIINSIYPIAKDVKEHVGHLIVDECHRTPSRTFTEAVTAFDCRYILGLSATPWRRDKLSKLIFWYVGDVHHEVDKALLRETGDILKAEVVTRETGFIAQADPKTQYSQMLSEMTEDSERNELIAGDVIREASTGGGTCLVLSDRKSHCDALKAILNRNGIMPKLLTGDTSNGDRRAIVEQLDAGTVKVLIATGQLIGEGFDAKSLQTLFLATPIKFDGRLMQYLGRVLRPAKGKDTAKVYDYVDIRVPVLAASSKVRLKIYQKTAA